MHKAQAYASAASTPGATKCTYVLEYSCENNCVVESRQTQALLVWLSHCVLQNRPNPYPGLTLGCLLLAAITRETICNQNSKHLTILAWISSAKFSWIYCTMLALPKHTRKSPSKPFDNQRNPAQVSSSMCLINRKEQGENAITRVSKMLHKKVLDILGDPQVDERT